MHTSYTNLNNLGAYAKHALLTGVLLFGLAALPATVVNASAYGCNIKSGISGPNSYCVKISGSSTYVSYVSGEFTGSQEVSKSYITAEFFDVHWHWYQTYKSAVTKGWTTKQYKKITINARKKAGWMCSTLHYTLPFNKTKTMSVCHQIKK